MTTRLRWPGPESPPERRGRVAAGRAGRADRARGVALVVAMLMLVAIGLLSAALMRDATGSGRIASGSRLQVQAGHFAQIALRYCEGQVALAPSARTIVPVAGPPSAPAWTVPANWTGASALAHTLSAADFGGARPPRVAPQCLAEEAGLPRQFTVTARGFSADFAVDVATGAAVAGAVVWLQSTVLLAPAGSSAAACSPGCQPVFQRRASQQLLTPPF